MRDKKITYHNKETRVGVDHLCLISGLQVPEDGGIVEEGQVDHVLALLKLGRVDSPHLRGLVGELLMAHGHKALASRILQVSRLHQTLTVSSSFRTGNPDRLFGIVRLVLVFPLHLYGGKEELGGVWVSLTLHQLNESYR